MYEIVHGPVPDGLDVLHTCDVPNCVSPWHLFLGTHGENMLDSAVKGRKDKKLDVHDVRRIKRLIAEGLDNNTIGTQFGVSRTTIYEIRTRRTRSYVA